MYHFCIGHANDMFSLLNYFIQHFNLQVMKLTGILKISFPIFRKTSPRFNSNGNGIKKYYVCLKHQQKSH